MSAEEEVEGAGEAVRGLFLIVPPAPPADLADRIDPLLAAGGTVGVLVRDDDQGRLSAAGAHHGVALFVDAPEKVAMVGAAGVLLDDPGAVADARRRLGDEVLIGAAAGVSRHAAMTAGEDGADFVAFGSLDRTPTGKLRESLAWWSELFVLPCLALARIEGEEDVAALVAAGADFVALPVDLVLERDDPAAAMAAFRRAVGAG